MDIFNFFMDSCGALDAFALLGFMASISVLVDRLSLKDYYCFISDGSEVSC